MNIIYLGQTLKVVLKEQAKVLAPSHLAIILYPVYSLALSASLIGKALALHVKSYDD
jgi:hypothetical protein